MVLPLCSQGGISSFVPIDLSGFARIYPGMVDYLDNRVFDVLDDYRRLANTMR